MNLPELPQPTASLAQWQAYISSNAKARGWDSASDLEIFLLFTEEMGELAKALRRQRQLFPETAPGEALQKAQLEVGEEMADVLSYLLDLASRLDVDLAQSLLDKERRNRTRTWG